jgi:hypothetical protein
MRQDTFFHHAGSQPLPHEAQYPPIIAPLPPHLASASPLNAIEGSTDIGIHDPPDTLLHAPLAELMPCLMGAPTLPKALGAVVNILRVDRFPPPGHRALDALVLAGGLATWTSSPIIVLDPDPLDGRCLGRSAAPSLVQVPQVLCERCGVPLCRHPVHACGAGLTRVAIRRPEKGFVDQVGEGWQHPSGIVGGLRRKALALWWDGW